MARIMRNLRLSACCAILLAGASIYSYAADATAQIGRNIMAKHQNAVVTIELVLEESASYGGQSDKRESKLSATGTVIDPSGLVVTSLSEIDPMSAMPDFGDEGYKISVKVTDAYIKMPDGDELPMNIVVRDKDLDLAFLKPKTAVKEKMPFVSLANPSSPLVLDKIVTLHKLGQIAGRQSAAVFDEIISVVTKPRKFFVVGGYTLGGPAFTLDGRPVGIIVLRKNPKAKYSESASRSSFETLCIVLPASTVMQAAEQAKKTK